MASTTIAIARIDRDPDQPRKRFCETALRELAENIKQHGLMQPIHVRKNGDRYVIVAGERRWRACKIAGLTEVPATLMRDGADHVILSIMENLHRQDLNVIEESDAFSSLLARLGGDENKLMQILGKPTAYVRDRLRLKSLSGKMREAVILGVITLPQSLHLSKLDHARQDIAFEKVGQMNSKQWGRMVESLAELQTQPNIFGDVPRETAEQTRVREKYDAILGRLTSMISKAFKADEMEVLARVLKGNVERRVEEINLIVKHLLCMADALRKAKATRDSVQLLVESESKQKKGGRRGVKRTDHK